MKSDKTDSLRVFWKPDGKYVNKENEEQLKRWMKENELGGLPLATFLAADSLSESHAAAIRDLRIPLKKASLESAKLESTNTGAILRVFWKPNGKVINKENEKQLKRWMKDNRLAGVSITSLLVADLFAEARARAIRDLEVSSKG